MDAILSKPEALQALSAAAADIFRRVCDPVFIVEAELSGDRAAALVTVWFPEDPQDGRAQVRVSLGAEGWSEFVDYRLRHEFIHVIKKRLDLEDFMVRYINAQIRKVIDAYA